MVIDKSIRLRKGRFGRTRPRHPWIYKRQILKANSSIKPGDVVSVDGADGKFIGRGYYNPRSDISVRILTFNDEPIDKRFFGDKIKAAVKKREALLARTNAYRAVFSEADALPGLIIDIYGDTAVFQVLTFGMERFKELIVEGTTDILRPAHTYEKSDSNFRKLEGLKNIKKWWGKPGTPEVEIFEGRLKFLVDIENGHKTGFYLDQRRSRMAFEGISKGRKVLDLFSYTGGFSISVCVHGASSALGIDIKREWLELAKRNATLNGVSERIKFIAEDAFLALPRIRDSGERFDMIIIDPPSFAKSRRDIAAASKGYRELNSIAMKTLNDKGILATFSCSHNMPNEAFAAILKSSAGDAQKKIKILKRCHQADDHPIAKAIPETEYLKGYFLEVNPG